MTRPAPSEGRRRALPRACAAAACAALLLCAAGAAEAPAQILQELRGFREMGSVLYVAAHPDDENTQLIAYLARGRDYRTALPFADPGRRRPERPRPGIRRRAWGHPHAGAPRGPPRRRRPPVLLPGQGLRVLQGLPGDADEMGPPGGPVRHRARDPGIPAGRRHHALPPGAQQHPRPPHGLGGPGARGVRAGRRPQGVPRAARPVRPVAAQAHPVERLRAGSAPPARGQALCTHGHRRHRPGPRARSFAAVAARSRSMHRTQGFANFSVAAAGSGPRIEHFSVLAGEPRDRGHHGRRRHDLGPRPGRRRRSAGRPAL